MTYLLPKTLKTDLIFSTYDKMGFDFVSQNHHKSSQASYSLHSNLAVYIDPPSPSTSQINKKLNKFKFKGLISIPINQRNGLHFFKFNINESIVMLQRSLKVNYQEEYDEN